MSGIPQRHVRVGRVLHEDDAFMTIEVPKDETRELSVEKGDRYLTMIFVHHEPDEPASTLTTWLPWVEQ